MLKIKSLNKKLGGREIIRDLNLEIPAGKITAFLGPNGAGKTTTMKMIAGILDPDSGEIWIDGLNIQKNPVEAKQKLGFVPDRPYLYEKLTGREMVEFVLGIYGWKDPNVRAARVAEMIQSVGMQNHADQRIENYSHGMKQRTAVACGLVHQPKILVIDEPMVGLDPHGYKMLFDVLSQFRAAGGAVFLSTHTLLDAQKLADHWVIIKEGSLVSFDPNQGRYQNLEEFYFSLVDGSVVA